MMLDSPFYCVVDLFLAEGEPSYGIEIVDKGQQKELFLHGQAAEIFRSEMRAFAKKEPDADDVEAFIERYRPWMIQPVTMH